MYDRSMAHIEKVKEVLPIEGADRIELISILDWKIIVKKNQFKVGDLAVFIEVDSILPDGISIENKEELNQLYEELNIEINIDKKKIIQKKIDEYVNLHSKWPQFEFLRKKKFRIKAIKYSKFNNIISQGIVFSLNEFPIIVNPKVGMDCTKLLEIDHVIEDEEESGINNQIIHNLIFKFIDKKLMRFKVYRNWKKEKNKNQNGWLSFFPGKSDEENAQKVFSKLYEKYGNESWVVTEKLEGQNITIWSKDKKTLFGKNKKEVSVCTHTRNLPFNKESGSQFWKTVKALGYDKIIASIPGNWFCRGEHLGPRIQNNIYQLKKNEIRFFDFYELLPNKTFRKLSFDESIAFSKKWNLPFVPVLDNDFKLPNNIDNLLSYSDGITVYGNNPKQIREGVILRLKNNYDISFKAKSPKYHLWWEGKQK